ncbi:MAG: response regulator [Phycisphaeraceae bacterium]
MTSKRARPLILAADDEVHILHVVSLKLRNAGFDVITAEDGEEAFEMALEQAPDLVITDFQMPYMTGLELCQKLRAHEATRDIPTLMLTARGFSLSSEDLEQTNIAGVLSKPFSPREVLARVQELIGDTPDSLDAPDTPPLDTNTEVAQTP